MIFFNFPNFYFRLMKYFLGLVLFFILASADAQQFAHFNTGTLFDSFENPAQRAFIPDSSRQFAFNFFIPNLSSTGSLSGNGQNSLHSLLTKGVYNSSKLTNGLANQNYLNASANSYWFMLKMYDRLDGDREFGLSAQTKVEGTGSITDETFLLLDNYRNFYNGKFNNDLFNDRAQVQAYHQLSLTFREKISPAVAFGIKLSGLLGIYYTKLNIEHSGFFVEKDSTQAILLLKGIYRSSYAQQFSKRDLIGYRNPGAAISFGMQAQLENGLVLQGNVKDFGFIRWNKRGITNDFNGSENIDRIAVTRNNDSRILTEADSISGHNGSSKSFVAPINGKADISISKKYTFFTPDFYYLPAFIVSKNIFDDGLTGAFVNHFTYKSFWATALATYNNNRVWNFGGQLMFKSPNAEFYIGAEQLLRGAKFLRSNYNINVSATGLDAFIGFSTKFGRFVEHPANASVIPMGEEKGFFARMWTRIFKRSYY